MIVLNNLRPMNEVVAMFQAAAATARASTDKKAKELPDADEIYRKRAEARARMPIGDSTS